MDSGPKQDMMIGTISLVTVHVGLATDSALAVSQHETQLSLASGVQATITTTDLIL
jgi:hypothetical protein